MLPGLRFLFVAIVLSMSMLVFGLGAAALLRTAHEEFANLPTRRAQPEPVFAQPVETTRPTLALLRVDAPPEPNATAQPDDTKPATNIDTDRPAAEPERITALNTTPPEEKSRPIDTASEASAATPAPAETPTQTDVAAMPVQAAATLEPPAPAQTNMAASEPPAMPADDSAKAAALKIATLGGPEVTIDAKAASAGSKTAASKQTMATSGKSAEPRRRVKRRRVARRVAVQAPVPAAADPFAPVQTAAVSQRRRSQ